VKYDVVANARRQAHQEAFMAECANQAPSAIQKLASQTGWRNIRSPLHSLTFDACKQTPQEPLHLLLENIAKALFLGLFTIILTDAQRTILTARFHGLDYPRGMIKIPFPFNSKMPERFGMSQVSSWFFESI
jgi:hypothetical protein